MFGSKDYHLTESAARKVRPTTIKIESILYADGILHLLCIFFAHYKTPFLSLFKYRPFYIKVTFYMYFMKNKIELYLSKLCELKECCRTGLFTPK